MIAADANDAESVGVTSITFPAKLLYASREQGEILFDGTMKGNVSGSADFDVVSRDGDRCVGRVERDGMINMTCEGAVISVDTGKPAKKTFSGAQYLKSQVNGAPYESVFGWGKGANETVLRQALAMKRSLTPKEVRALNPD